MPVTFKRAINLHNLSQLSDWLWTG